MILIKKPLETSTGHKGELYYLITNTLDKKRNINMTDGFEWNRVFTMNSYTSTSLSSLLSGQDGKDSGLISVTIPLDLVELPTAEAKSLGREI